MTTGRPLSQVSTDEMIIMHCFSKGYMSYKSPDEQGVPQELLSIQISLMEYENCILKYGPSVTMNVLGTMWNFRAYDIET